MDSIWQEEFNEIRDRALHIWQTQKWTDCRFLVGQKLFKCHKLMLAMASPVFERMFYGPLPIESDPIVINDVEPSVFKIMLQYIYSNLIYITIDQSYELCIVANKFELKFLHNYCITVMLRGVNIESVWRTYEIAKRFNSTLLQIRSMEIIMSWTRQILATPDFTNINMSLFIDILDKDTLNIDSEMDLFNALMRLAKINCGDMKKTNNDTTTSDDQASASVAGNSFTTQNCMNSGQSVIKMKEERERQEEEQFKKEMLRKAIKKIRFLTMTPQEFIDGPLRFNILQPLEALSILSNIVSPNNNPLPMPHDFSNSRCNRNDYIK